jgi:hypothetical protein
VTLSPDAGAYDVLGRIDPGDGASIKDSWSRLDLTGEDFARLVVGEWLWWNPSAPPDVNPDVRVWRRVTSAHEMAGWTRSWAQDPEDEAILRPALLDEPGVHVLAAHDSDGPDLDPVAGCIVNETDRVAGLSNTFSADRDEERAWRGAVAAAQRLVGALPLVGWDAGAGVTAAVSAGAERLGPLTVWIS